MMFCHECGERLVEGAKFCGSCGTKLAAAAPSSPPRGENPAPAPASPDDSSDEVKVLDAGDKYVLSGTRSAAVEKILQKFLKRGAKLITPVSSVGKGWAAACTVPPAAKSMDETQTLSLLHISSAADAKPAEPEDGCRVEEFGLKRIVYGPSLMAVETRLHYLKNYFGAQLVGSIEVQGEQWVAVVDMGSPKGSGFRRY
jgi:hypothetical protein